MIDFFMYLFKVTLVFTVLYLVYKTILNRFTFHTMNRFLLVALIPVSLLLPLSNFIIPNTFQIVEELPFIDYIALDTIAETSIATKVVSDMPINYWEIASIVYFLIAVVFILRNVLAVRKLLVLKKSSRKYHKEGYQLIETEKTQAFSFFGWIFIPKETSKELNPILFKHETTHAKLKHSFDIVFTELYTAFFWFNPLVYDFKKTLKSVHEFEVDRTLLEKDIQPVEYLQLLLQNLTNKKQEALYNHFSQPTLEKRVNMMTRKKSHRGKVLAYLIVFPIVVFLFMAFGKVNDKTVENISQQETSFLFPIEKGSIKDISSHFGVKRKVLKQERVHQGIDILANRGTAVLAASDGFVLAASAKGNWGNLIVIKHANNIETWYAHLKSFKITKNQQVKKGDVIGYVGVTGQTSGPHLHFELKHEGKNMNPLNYLQE